MQLQKFSSQHKIAVPTVAQLPQLKTPANTKFFTSPTFFLMLLCGAGLAWIAWNDGNSNSKLANSFWGGKAEIAGARKKAQSQINSPTRNKVCLYINQDPTVEKRWQQEWSRRQWKNPIRITSKDRKVKTFHVADVQRGTSVIGAAGTGKTFSVIDPMIRSSLDQGFPTLIYDFKYPAQTKRAAAYAAARGYKIRVFAPGFPESYTVNPLDFLKNAEDAIAAGQMAETINKNMNAGGGNKGGDKFFEVAGDSVVTGIFMLTKHIPKLLVELSAEEFAEADGVTPNKDALSYCDLMTSQAILALPNIAERIYQAQVKGKIGEWGMIPFSQMVGAKDSEKTVSSIVATAMATFQRFLKKDFISAFCGDTNLPLDIDGRELVIFGLDRNNRNIVGPLLATILHMVVSRNVSRTIPRKDPLVVFLDELPTIYLPQLTNWLNENREDGFCGILGFQNFAQLIDTYGKEISQAILGGTATKFIFNPQETESAERFAKILGEMEISYKTKSKSHSKGGGSNSTNNNKQKRHLFEPAEFLRLGTGKCVILNPNYTRGDEAYVPMIRKMQIRSSEIASQDWSEESWDSMKDYLVSQNKNSLMHDPNLDAILRHKLQERQSLAMQLFPLPEEEEAQLAAA